MAIFHSTTKIIGRASGRSSVAAAAYRAGEILKDERDGRTHDYTRKRGIEYSEIMLPENAPEEYKNRDILWNAVEQIEKRKDAQLAREIELGLPNELDRQSQIDLLKDYIQENFVKKGMCADFSLHDKGDGNPHAHIMLTTREINPEGFGKKERSWNDWQNVENWREQWAADCNRVFESKGIEGRIDHRSYAEQGIDREPTVHLGSAAHQLEKRGIQTDRGDINREVQSINRELEAIKDKLVAAFAEQQEIEAAPISAELTAAIEEPNSKLQSLRKEISETEFKISALQERKKEVVQVIEITEKYYKCKELLARKDTPANRNAFQSVRKQLMHMKFKDLPDLEALKTEAEELNNGINGFKSIKSEKEELYNGLNRIAPGDRQEAWSRGSSAPIGATVSAPPKKMSIKEQLAAAKIEADRKNAERKITNIPKRRSDLEH